MTAGHERAGTVGLVALVGTQLGQTLLSGEFSRSVVITSAASSLALAAIVQTPGVSHAFGCRPLGPLGWATALSASASATVLANYFPSVVDSVARRLRLNRALLVESGCPARARTGGSGAGLNDVNRKRRRACGDERDAAGAAGWRAATPIGFRTDGLVRGVTLATGSLVGPDRSITHRSDNCDHRRAFEERLGSARPRRVRRRSLDPTKQRTGRAGHALREWRRWFAAQDGEGQKAEDPGPSCGEKPGRSRTRRRARRNGRDRRHGARGRPASVRRLDAAERGRGFARQVWRDWAEVDSARKPPQLVRKLARALKARIGSAGQRAAEEIVVAGR